MEDEILRASLGGRTLKNGASRAQIIGNANQTFDLQYDLDDGGTYTVEFYVGPIQQTLAAGGVAASPKPQAEIQWCVEGNTVFRTVDVGNAVSISGRGQKVKVKVYDTGPLAGSPTLVGPIPSITYPVAILVTKGIRANYLIPPAVVNVSTTNGLIAPAGTTVNFPIPTNPIDETPIGVSSVEVVVIPTSAGAIPAQVAAPWAGTNPVTVVALVPHNQAKSWDPTLNVGFVSLPPGTTSINVINNTAAQNVVAFVTWGIEG